MAVQKAKKTTKASKAPAKAKASAAPEKSKRPGVIAEIASILKKASEAKPVTKDEIVEKLAKAFPERDAEKMRATVNVQLPGRIAREQGIDVSSLDGGYWAS